MIKIAILDDNDNDLNHLFTLLCKYFNNTNEASIDKYTSGLAFLDAIKKNYDIVFFDIDMPIINGLDVAKKLREYDENVSIVFVTYLAQLAINGYEVNAANFLVKPINYEQLTIVLNKLISKCQLHNVNKINIKIKGGYKSINLDKLVYIEVVSHELIFHTLDEDFISRGSLKDIEKELKDTRFVKCNSCYIVNLDYVNSVIEDEVILPNAKLLISRSKKKAFVDAFLEHIE